MHCFHLDDIICTPLQALLARTYEALGQMGSRLATFADFVSFLDELLDLINEALEGSEDQVLMQNTCSEITTGGQPCQLCSNQVFYGAIKAAAHLAKRLIRPDQQRLQRCTDDIVKVKAMHVRIL